MVCGVYTCAWVHVCVHVYAGLRLMLAAFLYRSLPCVLSQGLSQSPELPSTASLAGRLPPRLPSPLPRTGIGGSCFCLGSGDRNSGPHPHTSTLFPLSHLLSHKLVAFEREKPFLWRQTDRQKRQTATDRERRLPAPSPPPPSQGRFTDLKTTVTHSLI